MSSRSAAPILVTLASVLATSPVIAHDFWLRPSRFAVEPGVTLPVSLWVGEAFHGEEERGMQRARTERFVRLRAGGIDDLLPGIVEGTRPIGTVRFDAPGGHLLAMERAPTLITLEATRFNAYLASEGLPVPLAARRSRGLLATPGRERYVRGVKALVQVGTVRDRTFASVLGFTLEIIPDQDPAALHPGETLSFHLLYEGHAIGGVSVDACGEGASGITLERVVTDAGGAAVVHLSHSGAWLLRTVHMVACDRCTDADWSSAWTSYSFGI